MLLVLEQRLLSTLIFLVEALLEVIYLVFYLSVARRSALSFPLAGPGHPIHGLGRRPFGFRDLPTPW